MKHRVFDPLRLDMAAFAGEQGALQGEWPVSELARLADGGLAEPVAAETVHWQAEGEVRGRSRGGEPDIWLHIAAQAAVWLQCQRCLKPVREALAVQRSFRFVRTEVQAEAEDAQSEEDVLVLGRSLDLRGLVEDELILELPLVPRHDVCPEPLPIPVSAPLQTETESAPNPFAQLEVLKRGRPSH